MRQIHIIFKLFLFLSSITTSCYANFHWDLFKLNRLSAATISVQGTEATAGPMSNSNGITFTKETTDIHLNSSYYAYIAHTLQKSNDITFAVYFRINSTNKEEVREFPFFAMADTTLKENFFSIGLLSKPKVASRLEGKERLSGKVLWYVKIEQYAHEITIGTEFSLPVQMGEWTTLMVRIRGDKVTLSLNCQDVNVNGQRKLSVGRIGVFKYVGIMTFAQKFTYHGSKHQFVGSMYEPQLINGQKAYDWYNPCTRDNTPSVIQPEPTLEDYDDTKFRQFQEMNNQKRDKVIVYCVDKYGTSHRNNGGYWNLPGESRCYQYNCVDGNITRNNDCSDCTDGDEAYVAGTTWYDKNDPCKQRQCVKKGHDSAIKRTEIICNFLDCSEEERYLPKNACCPKCRQDDCTQNRTWQNSCEQKCSLGVRECKPGTKRTACWCPEHYALNHEETQCIPTRDCKCKVPGSDKMYLPGQAVKRSICTNCICSHGELTCFDIC